MENLYVQLLQRWEQAFDELEALSHYKAQAKTTLYSDGSRYDLKKFDSNFFLSGGPMTDDKESIDPIALHEYGFNAEGFPCYVAFQHVHNKITWEGYYTYSDTLVEYVEFCINTGVPSALHRLELAEGRKVAWYQMKVNGGASGHLLAQKSKEEIVSEIKNDDYFIISTITVYHYGPSGHIEKASNMHNMPGAGKYTAYDEYAYDNDQNLDTIRTFFEEGTNRLTYCRIPDGMDPDSLIESLAEAMARSTAATMVKQNVEQPLALLELNYRYADNYIPLLTWKSVREVAGQMANEAFNFIDYYYNNLQPETLPFERLFAQLEQMMEERNSMELGRIMLRKTAYLLTRNKLFGEVKVVDDFAAYAIDWSIEGHSNEQFEEILMECGVEANVIESYKQKGMLPPGQ